MGTLFVYAMTVPAREILDWLDSRFPPQWAEDWDRVGLQIGDPGQTVSSLGIALEVTPETVRWALREQVQLLVCHHPLFLHPLDHIRTDRYPGRCIRELLRNDLLLWVAHTNLDADPEGVSTALARRLRLQELEPLENRGELLFKLTLYVPAGYEETVQRVLREPGLGRIGAYQFCSFTARGEGRFTPNPEARPFRGRPGKEERAAESRIEMQAPRIGIDRLLKRIRSVHPYQEMAYDLFPLDNRKPGIGLGRLGRYDPPLSWESFLALLKAEAEAPAVRVGGRTPERVSRVAVCGGSGGSAIPLALAAGAQVLVTGEVGYHTLVEQRDSPLAVVTIGHYVSEKWIIPDLARMVARAGKERNWDVRIETRMEAGDPYSDAG